MVLKRCVFIFPVLYFFFSYSLYSFVFLFRRCFFVFSILHFFSFFFLSRSLFFFFFFDFCFYRVFCFLLRFSCLCFFFRLNLIGLGFNVIFIDSFVFRFYLGYSHFVYFFVGNSIWAFCDNKTRFLAVSYSRIILNSLLMFFLLLRRGNIYKLSGIYRSGILLRFKDNRHNK
jgi:hypothetical protein